MIANGLLDDGLFNPAGFVTGTLVTKVGQYSGQGGGTSLDTGLGDPFGVFDYTCCGPAASRFTAANLTFDSKRKARSHSAVRTTQAVAAREGSDEPWRERLRRQRRCGPLIDRPPPLPARRPVSRVRAGSAK